MRNNTTITKLGTEQDKHGNTVEVFRCEELGMSPIFPFFLRHYAQLVDKGHGYPVSSWNDKRCGAIYAMRDNTILGHIVFDRDNPNAAGALWITLSAVEESQRGCGIYTIMHKYCEQTARELGCWAIASQVHVNNAVRLKSADAVGMKPIFYTMGKRLK